MLIRVRCPSCDEIIKVARSHIGGKALCPGCRVIFTVDTAYFADRFDETGGTKIRDPRKKRPMMVRTSLGVLLLVLFTATLLWWTMPSEDLLATSKTFVERINDALEAKNDRFIEGLFSEADAQVSLSNVAMIKKYKRFSVVKENTQEDRVEENVKSFICLAEEKETGRKARLVFTFKLKDGKPVKILSVAAEPESPKEPETPPGPAEP